VWVPVTRSKETIAWAAERNLPITPGAFSTLAASQDMVRYYAQCLDQHGYAITPAHIKASAAVYVADSRQQAFKEAGPHQLYFRHTLLGHGVGDRAQQQTSGYLTPDAADFIRPEHREAFARSGDFRSHTLEDLERNERIAWGAPEEVRDRLIALAEALGAGTLTLNFNQGAMPHEMFIQNVQRFAAEVLPALKAHEVTTVPVA
jgi:alkanesulfonate monooxygenase SsuD/methylene tetrahydromethanopterin reductase-like flavin-dependent oxidoreductase (luciferase family)